MLDSSSVMLDHEGTRRRARGNYMPVVVGQSISLFGDYLAFFALPWLVVELTGRERDLGLTAAFETIPMLLFGFAAGVLLDRIVLRRALVFADLARAAAFGLLALAIAGDVDSVWMVFGVAFVVGSMSTFFDSGLQALLPSVLTDDMLVTANARLQLARTMAMVLGPAAAGVIIASFGGFETVFVLNAATFLASAGFILVVRELRPRRQAPRVSFASSLGRGLRWLWREPRLRWATFGAAAANMAFAPIEATLVLFARDHLSLGSAGTGAFFAAHALIGAVGVLVAPAMARRLSLGRMFVVGMAMLGGGFLAVSMTSSFAAAVLPAGVALAGVGWINVALATMRQRLTPVALMARVIAASRTIGWIGIPLGAAVGGFVADVIGVVSLMRIGTIAVLTIAVLLTLTPVWSRPVPADDRDADAVDQVEIPNR